MSEESSVNLPFDQLERCIHEPARLAVLSLLMNAGNGMTYGELRDQLGLTYGNLERHMRVLLEADIITVEKLNTGGRMQSVARFSDTGRESFLQYLDNLERILQTAQGRTAGERGTTGDATGLAGEGTPA